MIAINYVAILIAALANFIIGAAFHMPPLGNLWMKLANVKPPKNGKVPNMTKPMIKNYLVNVVFAFGIALVYLFMSTSSLIASGPGILTGIHSALLVWFFFLVTSSSIDAIWGLGKSWKLWLYEVGVSFLSCLAMGTIIATM